MNVVVCDVLLPHAEPRVGETSKTRAIEIDLERSIRSHERVNAQVELFSSDEIGALDVPLHNVVFRLLLQTCGVARSAPSRVFLPLANLVEFIEEEDALALRLAHGLHNPYATGTLELFHEEVVLGRNRVCLWEEVISARFDSAVVTLQRLLHALQVLYQQVLPCELMMTMRGTR